MNKSETLATVLGGGAILVSLVITCAWLVQQGMWFLALPLVAAVIWREIVHNSQIAELLKHRGMETGHDREW